MKTRAYTPYVGLPRRLGAALLDMALVLFLLSLATWILRLGPEAEAALIARPRLDGLFLLAAPAIIALCWLRFQGTPGKLLLGCRIIDARSGGRLRVWQVLVRLLGYVLSGTAFGLGFLWILWDKRRQGWHDKLARTLVVVDDESAKTLAQLIAEYR